MEIDCHGNTGNKNCTKPLGDALDSICRKLKHAELTLACPFATKIVRDVAGVVTHRNDAEEDEVQPVFLPPNFSMRALYLEWIRERGWDPVKTCRHLQRFKTIREWVCSKGFLKLKLKLTRRSRTLIQQLEQRLFRDLLSRQ